MITKAEINKLERQIKRMSQNELERQLLAALVKLDELQSVSHGRDDAEERRKIFAVAAAKGRETMFDEIDRAIEILQRDNRELRSTLEAWKYYIEQVTGKYMSQVVSEVPPGCSRVTTITHVADTSAPGERPPILWWVTSAARVGTVPEVTTKIQAIMRQALFPIVTPSDFAGSFRQVHLKDVPDDELLANFEYLLFVRARYDLEDYKSARTRLYEHLKSGGHIVGYEYREGDEKRAFELFIDRSIQKAEKKQAVDPYFITDNILSENDRDNLLE